MELSKLERSRFFFALTYKDYGLWQEQEVDYSLIPLSLTGKQMADVFRRTKLTPYEGWDEFANHLGRKPMVEICGRAYPDDIIDAVLEVLDQYKPEFEKWKTPKRPSIIRRRKEI